MWEERKSAAENRIKKAMGENTIATIGQRKITWKPVESLRIDSKRLKADDPDLYEAYCKKSSYRRFMG